MFPELIPKRFHRLPDTPFNEETSLAGTDKNGRSIDKPHDKVTEQCIVDLT